MTEDPVAKATRAYRRAVEAADARRAELADAVVHAVLVDKRRQSEVARVSGYTREHVRRICLDRAGVARVDDAADEDVDS